MDAPPVCTSPARPNLEHCFPLIVEDDHLYATLLVEAFKKNGVPAPNLRVLHDGEAAMAFLASVATEPGARLPSVVVLDLFLRRRSGLAVVSWMKSNPALERVPSVVLTGTRRPEDDARAFDLGVLQFLDKPLDYAELVRTVKRILATCETAGLG